MSASYLRLTVLALGLAAALPLSAGEANRANDNAAASAVGQPIADLALPDFHGQQRKISDVAGERFTVVAFLGIECPLVKLYTPRLNAMAEEFAAQGVRFVAVNPNLQDTVTEMAQFAHGNSLGFPLLKDLKNELTDGLGATRTPEVFVLDAQRVVRYRGRIDDQFGVGYQRGSASRHDLKQALVELVEGNAVSVSETVATGCLIGRTQKVAPHGDVTYTNQVARILQRRCVECHRPNELAPFALTSYDEVLGWAPMIREVVDQNRMPPWFADPRYGSFSNDCSLSSDEKQTLFQWIDNGCPQGDASQLPPPAQFADGWRITSPDLVLQTPEEYEVPAEGVVDYVNYLVDPGLTEDKWLQAAEARPGNRLVVHHMVVTVKPPGSNDTQLGFGDKMVSVYAPGTPPWAFPVGTAVHIPAGSKLLIQMHYTTCGSVQRDRSLVGIKWADPATVRKKAYSKMALNLSVRIPPGESNYVLEAKYKFRKAGYLLNLFPHMHYRGKSFRFEAEYPDGTHEVLLEVPNYDFAWQIRYDLVEPKLMPAGTRIHCKGVFDNSADNPRNPDPTVTVTFGEQSWEEMMVGFFTTAPAEDDQAAPSASSGSLKETLQEAGVEAGGQ